MLSGEQIQNALRKFAASWASFDGTEKGEAQTFLNGLFECYGADRRAVGAEFEEAHSSQGIMDLYWPDVVIIEMKAPREAPRLDAHRPQALGYWRDSANLKAGRPAPPYVVLCAFQRFEVWKPGQYPTTPVAEFSLSELPDRYENLLFLAGEEPLFIAQDRQLTKQATATMAAVYHSLLDRDAAPPEKIQAFVLQTVWCLFAEDYQMLRGHPTQQLIETLLRHQEWSSYMLLGGLFDVLNDPADYGRIGPLAGTQYVNGDLFAHPAKIHLLPRELERLSQAAQFDWRNVDPTIFGSLMEGFLGREHRWELGAHYTHEADIMKIVRPTIVEPWRQRIGATETVAEVRRALDDLCAFRVLDPACGCGNFLYVAYRELRHLEHELKERLVRVAQQTGVPVPSPDGLPFYPLGNLQGIDIEPASVQIARVTLWMGQRQMIDRFGAAERVLPLVDLSGIQVGDALRLSWPHADCIIGNPPFLGSQHIRRNLGDAYTTWLKNAFSVGVKDYCVYWFRKAHQHLGTGQRAGLVGTNSISQNRARGASLEYILANGGVITDAVSSQDWPGEAAVDVSLVNWIRSPTTPPEAFVLDGERVEGITAELRIPERSTGVVPNLPGNRGWCFQGARPNDSGFILDKTEAQALLQRSEATYRVVVRPYLDTDDITEDPQQEARRFVIDFAQMKLEEATRYPAALKIVRDRVKPERDTNNDPRLREKWWLFERPRPAMRKALDGLERYIAGVRHGKRLLVAWCDLWTLASDATYVFAFEDDYAMGVLASFAHGAWARSRSSTLEDRLRYTSSTVFASFPWPYPVTDGQRETIAAASRSIIQRRQEICAERNLGLTALYNMVDDGAYADLRNLHQGLDEAVAAAYGWPKAAARDSDEIVPRLLALNREIVAGNHRYDPFGNLSGPGALDFPEGPAG